MLASRLAHRWAKALVATSYVPLSVGEAKPLLMAALERLEALLHAAPFVASAGREVGAHLVDSHFISPRALAITIEVLSSEPALGRPEPELRQRWVALLGAVAEGFTARLVDRVRREQQEIIAAALTAREQAEQALRSSERRLERAREDFITTVSHELKTPLTPIKGYLHILLSRDEMMPAEQRRHYYRVMLDQAELLAGLVQDLLGAAELQHVGFSVRPETVPARPIIEKALETLPPDSVARFHWHGDDDLGFAFCDPLRLQQVIANLLSNADKYSPSDQPVHVSTYRDAQYVHLAVRDFGPGVPAELAEAVFDPFRRLGNSPQRGAGLGLHIARRLIEAMNGRVWLDPDSAPGALFRLVVPTAEPPEQETRSALDASAVTRAEVGDPGPTGS